MKQLKEQQTLLLDGAMGTELLRRGVDVSLPLWSARALGTDPEIVRKIHLEHLKAGADIITTNTFRTTTRTFLKVIDDPALAREKARAATSIAVDLIKKIIGEGNTLISGSISTLEDCYCPEFFPGIAVAEREFNEQAEWLVEAGIDLLLIETMGRLDEAEAVLKVTKDFEILRWVSFILKDSLHLYGGDSLSDAVKMCEDKGAGAILVNCTNLETAVYAIENINNITSLPLGVYPNLGKSMPSAEGEIEETYSLHTFERWMKQALDLGVKIVGSCCGSTPEHTRILRNIIDFLD
ncbi:MAG: homocysteine S-methyltransferase family protein [Candidatus Marinimicrobia bacterium]|nr:homocysteine S-methyltransferase family protein [Candidatus Neomarinimicrobiota bacterium]